MMLKKSGLAVLISAAVVLTFCSSSYTQGNSDEYFDHMETLIENFERIQAGMEVAFDPSLYIGSIQNLNFNHKKFSEAYRNRKERKYLSFALESSIVKTYMDLVEIIKTNSDRITLDVVNLAIDSNQLKITMLQNAVKIESTEGPMEAWVNLIEERIEAGEFASANEYVKLAREIYGSAKEFITLKVEIDDVLRKFDEDKEKAIQLMDEKEYRDALVILTQLKGTKPDDTEVARRYETAASYVEKMDELTLEAHSYEAEDKLKEAYRTWENLLEYDPDNEEALEKIAEYAEQLQFSTTEIVVTCVNCSGQGFCNICKGSGLCNICNGYRKCTRCRGAGFFARRCPYCVCKTCRGTGLCPTCEGRGTVTCTSCGGAGFHTSTKSVPCSVCGGKGKTRFRDTPCTACGGTGKVTVRVSNLCNMCKGAKVIPCPTCNGNGNCRTCGGLGHTPHCTHCGGKGVLTTPCDFCNRTGRCPECGGTGVCKYCKGSGKCEECNGSGIIITKIDEEKYLTEKNHFVSVITDPRSAQIYLDGELMGVSPLEIDDVNAGAHTLRITKPGYDDFHYKTVFTENYAAKFNIRLINKQSTLYRVVATSEEKHSMLFRHYQESENDSFMISLYVDGRNDWRELGEIVFGHEIAELKREFKTSYNPRLKERQVVDLSSLILMKPDGTEIKLLKNNLMQIVVYKAKLYDSVNKRFLYVVEGTKLDDLTVYNITGNEVILQDQDGELLTISEQ